MKRRAFLAGAGVVVTSASTGCLAVFNSTAETTGEYDVGMTDSAFDPETLEVDVGERVVWKNTSGRSHTVTAYEDGIPADAAYFASGGFASESAARDAWADGGGAVVSGGTYAHTFETPGEHHYVCIPHERVGMTGTIVVTD